MENFLFHFAYLDAGTGSIIIQAVVGVVAGISLFARRRIAPLFYKVRDVFSRKNTKSKTTKEDA